MAPFSVYASQVGLQQSEITKPPPLRIIKRSKTISGGSSSDDSIVGGRDYSNTSFCDKTTASTATDRPLTVHKIRKPRGSILSSRSGASSDYEYNTTIFDGPCHTNGHIIPAAVTINNDLSASGALLGYKHWEEDNKLSVEHSSRPSSLRVISSSNAPTQETVNERSPYNAPPNIPRRKLSKSKKVFFRTMLGRDCDSSQIMNRNDSSGSKHTLIRRMSHRRETSSSSFLSSNGESEVAISKLQSTPWKLSTNDFDVPELITHQRQPSFPIDRMPAPFSSETSLVLHPHIVVTPEVSSLDAGVGMLWVAITITGLLRDASGNTERSPGLTSVFDSSSTSKIRDVSAYGRLHSMRIDLHPGLDCTVLQIIGNLHESKTIAPGETQLVLAKMRLGRLEMLGGAVDDTTEGLIADLQNHLGDMLSAYLTVRLTYKHSGFPNCKTLNAADGMKMRISRIETEATATIKRCDVDSAWSPRNSRVVSSHGSVNQIFQLLEQHLPPGKALEIKKKLIDDKSVFSTARKFGHWPEHSLDDTVNNFKLRSHTRPLGLGATISGLSSVSADMNLPQESTIVLGHDPIITADLSAHELDDVDPARKIWSQMRLTSKGRQFHSRASLSANHYFALEDETQESRAPSRAASDKTTPKQQKSNCVGLREVVSGIGEERTRIMEIALKNKRSVGAETLKSIAPSVSTSETKSKRAPGTALRVGAERAWGWAPSWW